MYDDISFDIGGKKKDKLLSRIAALEAERDQLARQLYQSCSDERADFEGRPCPVGVEVDNLTRERDQLRAELAECKRDAERYRRLCSLVAWGTLGVCRVQSNEEGDDYADDGVMLDAWLDDPEMIAEAQGIDAVLAADGEAT